jgi:hypothetical protein
VERLIWQAAWVVIHVIVRCLIIQSRTHKTSHLNGQRFLLSPAVPLPFISKTHIFSHHPSAMSKTPSTSASREDHQSLFDNALKIYQKKIGEDLPSHPLRLRLESCHSPDAVLAALREQSDRSLSRDERLTRWLDPTVNVLWAFFVAVGVAVSLVSSQGVHGDSFESVF